MDLYSRKCVPCQAGSPTLTDKQVAVFISKVPGWSLRDNPKKIVREFGFRNFKEAISFVNEVSEIAENEGHHPNIYIHSFKKVRLELFTHKIGGLDKNDFILASKINRLV